MAKPIKIWDGTAWQEVAIQSPVISGSSYASTADLAAHEADTTNIHGISNTANILLSSSSYTNPSWLNITSLGNVSTGNITIESTARIDTTSTTITANTATTIASLPILTFRSAELLVQVVQGMKQTVSKLIMIHDGTNAYISEYAVIELGASRIPLTISATANSVDVLVQATISDASTTNASVKVVKSAIVV